MGRVIARVKHPAEGTYERILRLCAARGVSISAMCTAAGLNKSAAVYWKRGRRITNTSLMKIAQYFGVSILSLRKEDE